MKLSALLVIACLLVLAAPADSLNTCVTNCTGTTGVGMNCTVSLQFPDVGGCGGLVLMSTAAGGAQSASCLIGALGDRKATAVHGAGQGPAQGTAANCTFNFGYVCTSNPFPVPVPLGSCTVNAAGDGLPVELMAFSVE